MSNPKFIGSLYLAEHPKNPQWYVVSKQEATHLSTQLFQGTTTDGQQVYYYAAIVGEKIMLFHVIDEKAPGLPFVLDEHKNDLQKEMGGFDYFHA
jgi:hypothetical protein